LAVGVETRRQQLLVAYLNVTVSLVRLAEPDFTDRQKTVMLKVYLDPTPQTVRGLAQYANISKPAITRALDRLAEFDMIRRRIDPSDRRSVFVQRTPQGSRYITKLGDFWLEHQR